MALTDLVDQIDLLLTRRAKTSRIKPLLILLRDQCEACDLRISQLETEAKHPVLKTENDSLRRELDKAKKTIAAMQPEPPTRPRDWTTT